MDSARVVILLILLFFLLLAPEHQQYTVEQHLEANDGLEEKRLVELLANSHYGDLDTASGKWLNLTGFTEEDGWSWEVLGPLKQAARDHLGRVLGEEALDALDQLKSPTSGGLPPPLLSLLDIPLYKNITGSVSGSWVRSDLSVDLASHGAGSSMLEQPKMLGHQQNITGAHGRVQIKLDERTGPHHGPEYGMVSEVSAVMTIEGDDSPEDYSNVKLHGIHFPEHGSVILTTASEMYLGIFALPHFALSRNMFELTRQFLLDEILAATNIDLGIKRVLTLTYPWSFTSSYLSESSMGSRSCEYLVYLQQERVQRPNSILNGRQPALSRSDIELIESELRHPSGAPIPAVPKMVVSALIFSPDCGFVLESKGPPKHAAEVGFHLKGRKLEAQIRRVNRYTMLYALICCGQIWSLIRQMKEASTPSTVSRIGVYTIALMAMGDGGACMALTLGVFTEVGFLVVVSTAFIALMCASFFGIKFLMDIWKVQAPERRERERQRRAAAIASEGRGGTGTSNPTTTVTASSAAPLGLPPPVTATIVNSATDIPVVLPPDQDLDAATAEDEEIATTTNQTTVAPTPGTERREAAALYWRFYLILLGLVCLSLQATAWPLQLRSTYFNSLAFLYLSFWVPQLYRNVMRNCRKALRWEFIISQSLLRLSPIVYFYVISHDDAHSSSNYTANNDHRSSNSNNGSRMVTLLMSWVWIQIWMLFGQEMLGPRFFVPEKWLPPAYDYHPVLREEDLENGDKMPLGFSQVDATGEGPSSSSSGPGPSADAGNRRGGIRVFDCAICMQGIDVPIIPSSSTTTSTSARSAPPPPPPPSPPLTTTTTTTRTGSGSGPGSGSGTGRTVTSNPAITGNNSNSGRNNSSTTNDNNNNRTRRRRNSHEGGGGGGAGGGIFSRRRRTYMVTPCRHIFHTKCLEDWMRFRLQCPICRDALVPL